MHLERAPQGSVLFVVQGERLRPVRLTYGGTFSTTRTLKRTTTEGTTWTPVSTAETPGRTLTDTLVMNRENLQPISRRRRGLPARDLTFPDTLVSGEMQQGGEELT